MMCKYKIELIVLALCKKKREEIVGCLLQGSYREFPRWGRLAMQSVAVLPSLETSWSLHQIAMLVTARIQNPAGLFLFEGKRPLGGLVADFYSDCGNVNPYSQILYPNQTTETYSIP